MYLLHCYIKKEGFATLFRYTHLVDSLNNTVCMNIIHIHEGTENTFNVLMNLFYIFLEAYHKKEWTNKKIRNMRKLYDLILEPKTTE